MSMTAIAIWLLFFGLLPVVYWLTRLAWDYVLYRYFPHKPVQVEYKCADGTIKQTVITPTKDKELYQQLADFVAEARESNESTHRS